MKKAAKVEFGIQIVKPWSHEMYNHNDEVAELVRETVLGMWDKAMAKFQDAEGESFMSDTEWIQASAELKEIQNAVTCYGFGYGYTVDRVAEIVVQELEDAPYFRLKEIAEELELELEKGFVGFK